ncbi:MAG: DEAD/DEAH box helicase family protein [Bacteroidaceae bacterium]|nr:DEAD/DEAH box helicase family protein [Bacteroidaceae bacterium]
MRELLNRYCLNDKNDTGLLLLDMPTGTGKTYNVIQFIKDYLRENKEKKIFFVTTLKKNLDDPCKDLLNALNDDAELCDSVFRVLSNKEDAIQKFGDIKKRITQSEIKNSDEYKSFNALVSVNAGADAYGDVELKFRKLIGSVLSRHFRTKKEKLNAIKNDKGWQWVGELYPVVFSDEKRVFFVTVKKLINQFDTIVEKSVRLYESPIFKNSIVFIDEFDATKKDIQDVIVQEGLDKGIDFVKLFRDIKICLDNHNTIPSNIFDNVENKPSHKRALEKNIKIFDDIEEENHLLLNYKSDGFEEKRYILFSDLTNTCYTTEDEDVTVKYHKERNINQLQLVSKKNKDRALYDALDKIRGAISHFTRFVSILSYSYYKNKIKENQQQEGKSYGEFTEFHALDTVLDSLHLQDETFRIIRNMALKNKFRAYKKKKTDELKDDLYFYASGFSHYDFMDDYSHDTKTIIRKFVFEETPESIMYDICTTSKVIGISATATFPTVLGNYDIDYLEWKLGDRFVKPTVEDRQRFKETFDEQTKGYDQVTTIVELTETNSKKRPNWHKIFTESELTEEVQRQTFVEGGEYNENRYFKAALAFKQFLDNDLQSYLALFSKGASPNDYNFDSLILEKIFKYIAQEKGTDYDSKMFVRLESNNFDGQKSQLVEDLGAGERRFILSTYATLGAGQNLQYKIPSNRENDVVQINESRTKKEMDIEGIYLDKPTSIINKCGGNENDTINRVFQMEYLNQVKNISWQDKMTEITNSYKNIDKRNPQNYNSFKYNELQDFRVCATKTIVQAMGRKCRTNYRTKEIYILADSELGEVLDEKTLLHENRMFNREMDELAKKFTLVKQQENEPNRTIEIAKEDAIRSNKRIQNLLTRSFNNSWNNEDKQLWQNMREYVLKHPTLSAEDYKKSPFKPHYITFGKPVNQYFFDQIEDFNLIQTISLNNFTSAKCVSSQDVKLTEVLNLLNNNRIKDLFNKNGYAKEFVANDYIMSPPLYQNIYKGALGEAIGKAIFEHYGFILEELDNNEYEMFDFKVKDRPIYVDFKYWKESARFSANDYYEKVKTKVEKCDDVQTVIIANVRDTDNDNINTTPCGTFNIIELSLICNSQLSVKAAKIIEELKNE